MKGYDWDYCVPQRAIKAATIGHLTASKDAQANGLFYSSAGSNNHNDRLSLNNNNNNDDDDDDHRCPSIFLQSNNFRREMMTDGLRGFGSTVSETLAQTRPDPRPDFSIPPPNRPAPQITAPQGKPHFTIGTSSSPHHPSPSPFPAAAAAQKGDNSISGWASMTSSKVHGDDIRSHWDQSSVGNSEWFSIAFPEDETEPVQRSTTSVSFPVDEDSDAMPDYTWDVYDLRREDQQKEDLRREERDARSLTPRHGNDDEVYDPENPTNAEDEVPTTNPRPEEGLSESKMLCFLRLLEERHSSSSSSSIRYTVEQFVTCIPVMIDVETQRQRLASMSSTGFEIYSCLLHLAPKATEAQVINSMTLLPFILKSLGETALEEGDKHRETPPKDVSRSRSNLSSSSLRRRSRSGRPKSPPPPLPLPSPCPRPPEARRYGRRSRIRRSPPSSSGLRRRWTPKTRSGSEAPDWREAIARRERNQPRPSSGRATVRLDHLEIKEEEEEEETTSESRALDENKRRVLYFRNRSRKAAAGRSSAGSDYVEPNGSGRTIKTRLPLRQGFRPPMPFFRRKPAASEAPVEKLRALLDIDFSVPRFPRRQFAPVEGKIANSADPLSTRASSSGGREPPAFGRGSPIGGLLPDPGTIEYRTVIQRSVTTRLGSRSPRSTNDKTEFPHSTKRLRQINNGKM